MTFSERNLFEDDSLEEEDDSLEEENAFDLAAKKIAEAKESIMGTDEERERRERGSMKRFFKKMSPVD